MTDWRPICEVCEAKPQSADDLLCLGCRARVELESSVITDPLELLLNAHLSVRFPNDKVMCLCHSDENRAVFDGPALHRQHLAALIYGLFGLPGPTPHEPALLYEAKRSEADS